MVCLDGLEAARGRGEVPALDVASVRRRDRIADEVDRVWNLISDTRRDGGAWESSLGLAKAVSGPKNGTSWPDA